MGCACVGEEALITRVSYRQVALGWDCDCYGGGAALGGVLRFVRAEGRTRDTTPGCEVLVSCRCYCSEVGSLLLGGQRR